MSGCTLIWQAVGQDGVQRVGDTTYTILKPTVRIVYTRDLTTQQQRKCVAVFGVAELK